MFCLVQDVVSNRLPHVSHLLLEHTHQHQQLPGGSTGSPYTTPPLVYPYTTPPFIYQYTTPPLVYHYTTPPLIYPYTTPPLVYPYWPTPLPEFHRSPLYHSSLKTALLAQPAPRVHIQPLNANP